MEREDRIIIGKKENPLIIFKSYMVTSRSQISSTGGIINTLFIRKIEACLGLFNRRLERRMLGAIIIFKWANCPRETK